MTEPFRQRQNTCPECGVELRPFNGRLCCDRCEGIFLGVADLARAVDELTKLEPALAFSHDKPGHRRCPTCAAEMVRCRVELTMADKVVAPKVELDRCAAHGVWFDTDELAEVFFAVEREFGSHGGASGPSSTLPGDGPLGSYGKFNAPP
ncbi:MAG TPA: zf-TFIIB domain-containing protein [Kofleriaceae bacterium]|jgi:Zn-finger nucleic acid-binding protein